MEQHASCFPEEPGRRPLMRLVRRCLRGEEVAIRQLVERFQGPVFSLCYRMLGNRHDAEDACQETLLRMLRSLRCWDAQRDFEPWLLAIAGNRCRTVLAARKRRPAGQSLAEQPAAPESSRQGVRQLIEEVEAGLRMLRCEHRQAFVLFHENGLSYEQISHVIQRPVGTVKTWIHRARRELLQYLVRREVIKENADVVRAI